MRVAEWFNGSTRHRKSQRGKPGITLIMVAGVLSIMAALGTAFFIIATMQARAALHYSDAVRAELMAKAGIADAAARLRMQAFERPESPSDPWYPIDWLNGAHTVFGKVIEGQNVVDALGTCRTGPGDKPNPDQKIVSVEVNSKRNHPYVVKKL